VVLLGAVLAATGCGDDSSGPSSSPSDDVEATIEGFPASSPDFGHYELWLSFFDPTRSGSVARHESAAISAGKFRVDSASRVVGLDGQAIQFAVRNLPDELRDESGNPIWVWAQDAFVTLEPDGDSDDDPTFPGFLGGVFLNGLASLSTSHGDALGADFSTATGAALLATPSTSDLTDELKGIWFTDADTSVSSFALPALPDTGGGEGWVYEAWVETSELGVGSLGRFLDPATADDDRSGPLHGQPPTDGPGWPFPGSDFPFGLPPSGNVDLAPSAVFVTVEPASDADGPGPFRTLTVLTVRIPTGWLFRDPLTLSAEDLPTAIVEIPISR
jgi:hypothetical protein